MGFRLKCQDCGGYAGLSERREEAAGRWIALCEAGDVHAALQLDAAFEADPAWTRAKGRAEVLIRGKGANLARNEFDIGRACMPLVRLLLKDGLCWSDREQIARAIQDNLRQYDDWQREKQHLQGGAAQGR